MGMLSNRAIAIDPALMMVKAKMPPDPWQAGVLRDRAQRLLLNCTRQAGKSTVIACSALIEALYYAPSLTLLLSPSERQSKELFRTVLHISDLMGASIVPDSKTTTHVEFASGSRIVALPAKESNIRGLSSVALLIVDEASRVADELYHSVRPMLAVSGGRIACLSTPFGKRGFFHKEWTEGEGWQRVMIKATECPRISAQFLAEEKKALPDTWYRQEYLCEFCDLADAMFKYEDVMQALSDDVQPFLQAPLTQEQMTVQSPFVV